MTCVFSTVLSQNESTALLATLVQADLPDFIRFDRPDGGLLTWEFTPLPSFADVEFLGEITLFSQLLHFSPEDCSRWCEFVSHATEHVSWATVGLVKGVETRRSSIGLHAGIGPGNLSRVGAHARPPSFAWRDVKQRSKALAEAISSLGLIITIEAKSDDSFQLSSPHYRIQLSGATIDGLNPYGFEAFSNTTELWTASNFASLLHNLMEEGDLLQIQIGTNEKAYRAEWPLLKRLADTWEVDAALRVGIGSKHTPTEADPHKTPICTWADDARMYLLEMVSRNTGNVFKLQIRGPASDSQIDAIRELTRTNWQVESCDFSGKG